MKKHFLLSFFVFPVLLLGCQQILLDKIAPQKNEHSEQKTTCEFKTLKNVYIVNYTEYDINVTACDEDFNADHKSQLISNDRKRHVIEILLSKESKQLAKGYTHYDCSYLYPNQSTSFKYISIDQIESEFSKICFEKTEYNDSKFIILPKTDPCPVYYSEYLESWNNCRNN